MHHPTDRIIHATAFVTPVVKYWLEREIAQWVHPMKDRSDNPSHNERTLLLWSYILLPTPHEDMLDLGGTKQCIVLLNSEHNLINMSMRNIYKHVSN